MNTKRQRREHEQGSLTVVFAVALVAIIGLAALATDIGRVFIEQQRVATVADAAALSGAQFLPQDRTGAAAAVQTYLTKNGVDPKDITMAVDPAQNTVTVTVDGSINYTFARIFGQTTGHVQAQAVAKVASVTGYNNVVPLGVVQSDWKLGSPVTLKAAPGGGGHLSPGDFGALSLGGTGAATYENNLRNGYTGWIRVGDLLPTEPGNVAGPTHRAVQARIDQDPYATWATVRKGSPRIAILPVLESFNVNGRGEVKVVGFGAFFLEQVVGQGNNMGDVSGRFLRYVVVGESTGAAADFAAYTIKLTH